MKRIIDIPDYRYQQIQDNLITLDLCEALVEAVIQSKEYREVSNGQDQ